MVLAVDIVGNRTPNRHQLGPRRHGQNPAAWNDQPLDVPQQHASLTHQAPSIVVECDEMVKPGRDPERAFRIQADVSVTATHAVGHTRVGPMANQRLNPGGIIQTDDMMRIGAQAPPRGNRLHTASVRKT